jgi:hypothetical protein
MCYDLGRRDNTMKKIPNLFQRDEEGNLTHHINPDCQWVVDGEGVATRKFDGTSCMAKDGNLWKRRTVKPDKAAPVGFIECTHDEITGKRFGWVPVTQEDKFHLEALAFRNNPLLDDWTYELCGPKIQGNPEKFEQHQLIPHGTYILVKAPRDPEKLYGYFKTVDIEGIVWWHEDGRKCKLRKGDYGQER